MHTHHHTGVYTTYVWVGIIFVVDPFQHVQPRVPRGTIPLYHVVVSIQS